MTGEAGEIAAFYAARLDEEESHERSALVEASDGAAIRVVGGELVIRPSAASGLLAGLRDVEARRAVLADCVRVIGPERERRYSGSWAPYDAPAANLAFRTLLSLVSAYDGHPDYREAWKR